MDLSNLIKSRRSHRAFLDKKINNRDFEKILLAGTFAPSPKNRQPWFFYIISCEKKREIINILEKKLDDLKNNNEITGSLPISIEAIKHSSELVLVYNIYSNKESDYNSKRWSADTQSIGAAIQNMLLEAKSMNIDSLWICDVFYAENEVNKLIGTHDELVAAVVFGYGQYELPLRPRIELKNRCQII